MSVSQLSFATASSLVLRAGAGTGKTHALATRVLHLLAGLTERGEALPPARLVALTFTERAAAELRERLQRRIARLALDASAIDDEPQLAQSAASFGRPLPSPDDWALVLRAWPDAFVGTIHAFCAQQLRRAATRVHIEPAFEVLDEREATALLRDELDAAIFDGLARKDAGTLALANELGVTSTRPRGLMELALRLLRRLAEEGRSPASLDQGHFTDELARTRLASARDRLQGALDAIASSDPQLLGSADTLDVLLSTARDITPDSAIDRLERVIEARRDVRRPRGRRCEPLERLDEAVDGLRIAIAGLRTAPLGRALVALLTETRRRYEAAKQARGVLDFADLQVRLRDALRDDPALRTEVKSRIGALAIDEMQDTSRVQLDLIALLAERREQSAELEPSPLLPQVSLEPGLLCVVGDAKQSIYGFRGADVSVFTELDERLSGEGAHRSHLRTSHRSRPALVALVNEVFARAMGTGRSSHEVSFAPEDALVAAPESEPSGPLAEWLVVAANSGEAQRVDEAVRVAARVRAMLDGESLVRGADGLRPVEGRDVALLFRRFTHLDYFRRALRAYRIPHIVVGGGGFYETQGVLDCWALLRVLEDPSDRLASSALLRSPWCSLPDASLTAIAIERQDGRVATRGLSIQRLLDGELALPTDDAERLRVERVLSFVRRYSSELERLGAHQVLRRALVELQYLAVVAVLPEAETIAANVEKLVGVLEELSRRQPTARNVVRTLTERVRTPEREPEASSSDWADPRCVRLMTIHQAKGQEFPVVFVVECGAGEPPDTDRIAYERELGLALSVRLGPEDIVPGPGLHKVRERLRARSRAEHVRLFYVAATRARDYVVFSGVPRRGSWAALLDEAPPELLRRLESPPPARIPDPAPPEPSGTQEPVLRPLPRLASPVRVTTRDLAVFSLCEERFRLECLVAVPSRAGIEVDSRSAELLRALVDELDWRASREGIEESVREALRAAGLRSDGVTGTRLLQSVRALASNEWFSALSAVPSDRNVSGTRYRLPLELDGDTTLVVEGALPSTALGDDALRLVELAEPGEDDDALGFRLLTHALAARRLIANSPLRLDAALLRMESPRASPHFDGIAASALDAHEQRLIELGRRLVRAMSSGRFEPAPIDECRARRCRCLELRAEA